MAPWHLGLYKIKNKYVQYVLRSPTTMRAVAANNGPTVKQGVKHQLQIPPTASDIFPRRCLMPVCDNHRANIVADLSILQDEENEEMDKVNCKAHVGHKIYI